MLHDPTLQCPHNHTSLSGSYHFSNGEVWDDIHEVCDDCGAILDTLRPLGEFIDEEE